MNDKIQILSSELNRAIIKYRGAYSAWAKSHGISYNKMLVIFTAMENGFCTQKNICESYLLPKQTINHVFVTMINEGELIEYPEKNVGKEKAYRLTEKGIEITTPLLNSVRTIEERAALNMGLKKLELLNGLITEYGNFLADALEELN